jgi:two-component system, NarL family, nitrate/nitrite response regulator NarL
MQTSGMDRFRVMLVEDDDFTRSMIASALQLQGIDVVCETASASPALKLAETLRPNAAVIDLDLGVGPNGIDVAIALRRRLPGIGIVILTTYEDPRLIGPKILNPPIGAVYLIKRQVGEIETLYKSIQKSISNVAQISKVSLPAKTSSEELGQLTESQLDTMRLLSKGLSNSEIAKLRGVTEKSVEQSIARLVKNLNIPKGKSVNQRVQISRLYFKLTGSKVQSED